MADKKYCTVPNIFCIGEWFERKYKISCMKHDNAYKTKIFSRKEADIDFLIDMIDRTGTVIIPVISYYLVRLFGQRYWDAA